LNPRGHESWWISRLATFLFCFFWTTAPTRCVLVSANDRGVDDSCNVVVIERKGFEYVPPLIGLRPFSESIVERLPAPESFRKVTPRSTSLGNPQNRIYEVTAASNRGLTRPPFGKRGSIFFHCASVSSCRRIQSVDQKTILDAIPLLSDRNDPTFLAAITGTPPSLGGMPRLPVVVKPEELDRDRSPSARARGIAAA